MRRTPLILLLSLLAFALPASAAAKVPDRFFGITSVDPTEKDFSRMDATGFGLHRFELSWRVIQQTRNGPFDWGYVDDRMRGLASAGMDPAMIVFGTPRFVRKSADGFFPPTANAENRKEWQQFLVAATKRYGPGGDFFAENPGVPNAPVEEWIIWNEQNSRNFWRPKPNPADYAKLVEISDRAVSKVDPKADIVLGGMYGYPKDERSIPAKEFIRELYRTKGIERHFETISLHPYGAGVGTVRKQIAQARSAIRKAGDSGVQILISEIGWASTGPSSSDQVVGAKGQATRLRKSLNLLIDKRRSWNIIGAYIYLWRDFTMETACLWCPGAGLTELDGSAKPSLDAVRSVIRSSR